MRDITRLRHLAVGLATAALVSACGTPEAADEFLPPQESRSPESAETPARSDTTTAPQNTAAPSPTATASASATPRPAVETGAPPAVADQFPDVVDARLEATGDTWTLHATISSPYDSASRYADGFRAKSLDGKELDVRSLAHPHPNEQPFTRTLPELVIPTSVTKIEVEARDSVNGWGGASVIVTVPPRPAPSSGEPTTAPQPERIITEDDTGEAFSISPDTQAVLRLRSSAGAWSEPTLQGSSITLLERSFVRDPGYREWEMRVADNGLTNVRSQTADRTFEVSIVVG